MSKQIEVKVITVPVTYLDEALDKAVEKGIEIGRKIDQEGPDRVYSVAEACAYLDITRPTLIERCKDKGFKKSTGAISGYLLSQLKIIDEGR